MESPRTPAPELEQLIRAGAMLSNCAFNLKQWTNLDADAKRSLEECQKRWDLALQVYRAAPVVPLAPYMDYDAVAMASFSAFAEGAADFCEDGNIPPHSIILYHWQNSDAKRRLGPAPKGDMPGPICHGCEKPFSGYCFACESKDQEERLDGSAKRVTEPQAAQEGEEIPIWATGRFTFEFALYNMIMAWKPEQCFEFYRFLSRRTDFNPEAGKAGPGYRLLTVEDTVEASDEVYAYGIGPWEPVQEWTVGKYFIKGYNPMRRTLEGAERPGEPLGEPEQTLKIEIKRGRCEFCGTEGGFEYADLTVNPPRNRFACTPCQRKLILGEPEQSPVTPKLPIEETKHE